MCAWVNEVACRMWMHTFPIGVDAMDQDPATPIWLHHRGIPWATHAVRNVRRSQFLPVRGRFGLNVVARSCVFLRIELNSYRYRGVSMLIFERREGDTDRRVSGRTAMQRRCAVAGTRRSPQRCDANLHRHHSTPAPHRRCASIGAPLKDQPRASVSTTPLGVTHLHSLALPPLHSPLPGRRPPGMHNKVTVYDVIVALHCVVLST